MKNLAPMYLTKGWAYFRRQAFSRWPPPPSWNFYINNLQVLDAFLYSYRKSFINVPTDIEYFNIQCVKINDYILER